MKVLVVYAHPNPESFNHAVLEAFTKGLNEAGHPYEIVDLYGINFDPRLKVDELQPTGWPKDVLEQQEKVSKADALVFIYPVWWMNYPAILRGWFDRVLKEGIAFKMTEKGELQGLLRHQEILFISTAMGSEEDFKAYGLEDAMRKIETTLLNMCGVQNIDHVFLYDVMSDAEARKRHLEQVYRLGKAF